MQYLLRAVIAAIVALALFYAVPHILNIFRVQNADLVALLNIVIGFGALYYVVKGPPIPFP